MRALAVVPRYRTTPAVEGDIKSSSPGDASRGADDPRRQKEARRLQAKQSEWALIARNEFAPRASGAVNTARSPLALVKFRSPAAYRLQIRSHSCDIWFPKAITPLLGSGFTYMVDLVPQSPALALSLDAASLLQVGQEDGDIRLLATGVKLYGEALRYLRGEIALRPSHENDGAVAAILNLQICDFFTSLSCHSTWQAHADGLSSLMQTRPARDMPIGLRHLMDAEFHLFLFWHGLLARKRIDLLQPLDASALNSIAVRVPELLEECDVWLATGSIPEGLLNNLSGRLQAIEGELTTWAANWNRDIRDPPYSLVPASKLPYLTKTAANETWELLFDFKTLENAIDHVVCTAALMSIRQARMDTNALTSYNPSARRGLEEIHASGRTMSKITECADSLCMSLPFLCKPEHGKYGVVISAGPLCLATKWYMSRHSRRSAAKKLDWCRQAAQCIRGSGIQTIDIANKS